MSGQLQPHLPQEGHVHVRVHVPCQVARHAGHRDRLLGHGNTGSRWGAIAIQDCRPPAALLAALSAAQAPPRRARRARQPVPDPRLPPHRPAPPGASNPAALGAPPPAVRRQLRALDRAGYEAVTLDQVWRAWHGRGALPARPRRHLVRRRLREPGRSAAPALEARRWRGVLNLQTARLGVARRPDRGRRCAR